MERRKDSELLTRAKRDPAAFGEFYRRHVEGLNRWLSARVGNEQVAMDLTAETFAKAWLSVRKFKDRSDGSAAPWLWTIAANLLRDYYRRERFATAARSKLKIATTSEQFEPAPSIETNPIGDRLAQALAALPEEQCQAVELRVLKELEYEEVSRRLNCSQAAARAQVSRGLRALRTQIATLEVDQ